MCRTSRNRRTNKTNCRIDYKTFGAINMISVWWLIPAVIGGAVFGVLLIAVVSANKHNG